MEENLAFPTKNIILKYNSLNSFWYRLKDIIEYPKSLKPGDFVKIFGKNEKLLKIFFTLVLKRTGIKRHYFSKRIYKSLIKEFKDQLIEISWKKI